jgi:tripartite-type tricarboxylate transporter receptor subunit TctC
MAQMLKLPHRRQFLHLAASALALPAVSPDAWAQDYPARPITIVVPFAAGGPTDTLARILAERLAASLKQTVVIENTVGAAGSIGVNRVARALPDGYTVSIGHLGTHVINGAIYPLQYDLVTDFEPIGLIADHPSIVVSKNAVPAKDLQELIVWARSNGASVGTSGVGAVTQVAGIHFRT